MNYADAEQTREMMKSFRKGILREMRKRKVIGDGQFEQLMKNTYIRERGKDNAENSGICQSIYRK